MAHFIDIGQKGPYGWSWASYPSAKGFTAKQQGRSRSAESAVTFHDATAPRPWRYNSREGYFGDASAFQVRTAIPDPIVSPTPPASVPPAVPVVPITTPPAVVSGDWAKVGHTHESYRNLIRENNRAILKNTGKIAEHKKQLDAVLAQMPAITTGVEQAKEIAGQTGTEETKGFPLADTIEMVTGLMPLMVLGMVKGIFD